MEKYLLFLIFALLFVQCDTNLNDDTSKANIADQTSDFFTINPITNSESKAIESWSTTRTIKSGTENSLEKEHVELLEKINPTQIPDVRIILGQYEKDQHFAAYYINNDNTVFAQLDVIIEQEESGVTIIEYTNAITKEKAYLSVDKQGKLLPIASTKANGQDTSDCIADAYTNHGWVSVWAWVQTAVIPATAVAIAAACIAHNL